MLFVLVDENGHPAIGGMMKQEPGGEWHALDRTKILEGLRLVVEHDV